MQSALQEVGRITDIELVSRLERLVNSDRALCAKLLVHLGEVEARNLHRERSYSSMFDYCTRALGMSEAEAHLRILAARVGKRFPLVLERLSTGKLHLSGIKLLAPYLTAKNHGQLLDRVQGMSKHKIEVLVADLAPKPDVPARIRKVPERRMAKGRTAPDLLMQLSSALTVTAAASSSQPSATGSSPSTAQPPAAHVAPNARPSTFTLEPPRPRATSKPLGLERVNIQLTLGQEAHTALEQLVELFRHQNPSGDFTCIVERALCELLKSTMKRRFAQTNTSTKGGAVPKADRAKSLANTQCDHRTATTQVVRADLEDQARTKQVGEVEAMSHGLRSAKSRFIPRAVLREVHARDNGQCTFLSADGRRCTERGFLEVHHHHTTFARGGEASAENLRLVCRAHNLLFAERDYGRAWMRERLQEAAARKQLSLVPGKELV